MLGDSIILSNTCIPSYCSNQQVHESTIIKVIVESHALNWNKLVNWNSLKEHIYFQFEDLSILPLPNYS